MAQGVRSWRERIHQTLCFEVGGLLVVSPLFAWASGATLGSSVQLLLALSLLVTVWTAVFNAGFDHLEWRCCRRVASDRPHAWRLVHAVALEATAVIVSCPAIVALTDLGWSAALVADLGLTLAYAVYGYAFHRLYDRWWPVSRRWPPGSP